MIWFCRIGAVSSPTIFGVVAAVVLTIAAIVMIRTAVVTHEAMTLAWVATIAAAFQAGHFSEHSSQMAGLVVTGDLTFTVWARQIVYGYSWLFARPPDLALESLHFWGDLLYLAGLVAWYRLKGDDLARWGLIVQLCHQAEHTSLFLTSQLLGEAVGLTTLGSVPLRIMMHFTLNFGGSVFWLLSFLQDRLLANRWTVRWAT